jgi:hypothetical protein
MATLTAATPPTVSESGRLDPWEALHQRLALYGRLAVIRLPNKEDRRRSRKPAHCGRSFAGICQVFTSFNIPSNHTLEMIKILIVTILI